MNVILKPFGFRTNATSASQAAYWVAYIAAMVGGFVSSMTIWRSTRLAAFDALNGCVDAQASQHGEQAYRPSQEYLDCIQGPQRTAFLLSAVAVSAFLLIVLAGMTWLTQYLIFSDFVRLDNRPASTRKVFNRIYCGFGVWGLVLVIITLILVGPRS